MHISECVQIKAHKSDGTCYRWWQATVEAVAPDHVVLVTPAGHRVEDIGGGWTSQWAIRSYYWPGRRYSLLEVYTPDGRLVYFHRHSVVGNGFDGLSVGETVELFVDNEESDKGPQASTVRPIGSLKFVDKPA